MTTAYELRMMRAYAQGAGLDMFVRQLDRQIARRASPVIEAAAITYAPRQLPDIETRG